MWGTARAGKPPSPLSAAAEFGTGTAARYRGSSRLTVRLSSYQAELFTLGRDKSREKAPVSEGEKPATRPMTGNMSAEEVSQSRLAQTRAQGGALARPLSSEPGRIRQRAVYCGRAARAPPKLWEQALGVCCPKEGWPSLIYLNQSVHVSNET